MTRSGEPLALFDLDDTLSDRSAAFAIWAQRFLDLHGIDDPDALPWMLDEDDGGYRARYLFFMDAKDRFRLPDRVDDMADDYQRTSHESYQHDPALISSLQRLIGAGWRVGIVTNGGDGQDEKVDRLGIRPLLSCCVVSGTVGLRKPDPAIFEVAIDAAGGPGATGRRPWMVGDHARNDIGGAQAAGLRTIWLALGREWDQSLVPPEAIVPDLQSALAMLEGHPPDR